MATDSSKDARRWRTSKGQRRWTATPTVQLAMFAEGDQPAPDGTTGAEIWKWMQCRGSGNDE